MKRKKPVREPIRADFVTRGGERIEGVLGFNATPSPAPKHRCRRNRKTWLIVRDPRCTHPDCAKQSTFL